MNLGVGEPLQTLKARAVIVDMEQGVINEMLRSEIGDIFDTRHFISEVSGAGNNWAVGHYEYGNQYKESICEQIRYVVE
jgi:tubulin epsilon